MLMSRKQKLELTWIGKENRPKLELRILLETPAKSYHAKHRVASTNIFDNRLLFGDNLLGLEVAFATAATTFENGIFKYFAVHQRVTAT